MCNRLKICMQKKSFHSLYYACRRARSTWPFNNCGWPTLTPSSTYIFGASDNELAASSSSSKQMATETAPADDDLQPEAPWPSKRTWTDTISSINDGNPGPDDDEIQYIGQMRQTTEVEKIHGELLFLERYDSDLTYFHESPNHQNILICQIGMLLMKKAFIKTSGNLYCHSRKLQKRATWWPMSNISLLRSGWRSMIREWRRDGTSVINASKYSEQLTAAFTHGVLYRTNITADVSTCRWHMNSAHKVCSTVVLIIGEYINKCNVWRMLTMFGARRKSFCWCCLMMSRHISTQIPWDRAVCTCMPLTMITFPRQSGTPMLGFTDYALSGGVRQIR